MEAIAWQTYLSAPPGGLVSPSEQPSLVMEDGSAADGDPAAAAADVDPAAAAGSAASIAVGTTAGTAGGAVGSLSSARRLMLQYRVQKKMVFWDAVLAAAWAASKSSEANEGSRHRFGSVCMRRPGDRVWFILWSKHGHPHGGIVIMVIDLLLAAPAVQPQSCYDRTLLRRDQYEAAVPAACTI